MIHIFVKFIIKGFGSTKSSIVWQSDENYICIFLKLGYSSFILSFFFFFFWLVGWLVSCFVLRHINPLRVI